MERDGLWTYMELIYCPQYDLRYSLIYVYLQYRLQTVENLIISGIYPKYQFELSFIQ